jgi:outer membrane usher protein FimD/PapC
MKRALTMALIFWAAVAKAQTDNEQILAVSVNSERPAVVMVINDEQLGWLVPYSILPTHKLKPDALIKIARTERDGQEMVAVAEIGSFLINERDTSAKLQLRPELLLPATVSLSPFSVERPDELHQGPAFMTNVFATFREEEARRRPGYLAVVDSRLSAGILGTLHGGFRTSAAPDSDVINERLPFFLETHFIDQMLTLRSGEVRAQSEVNDVSYGVAGFQLQSNFLTRPDLFQRPTLDFFTALESPSVVELFVDGQRRFREEFQEPGEVMLSDFRPSGDGRVLLLVTDASGTQRVVEADFYNESGLLQPGLSAYSVSGGLFRQSDGDISRSGMAAFNWLYGFTERFTAGVFAEAAGFDDNDSLAQGRSHAGSAGLSFALSSPFGGFNGSSRWRSDSLRQEGYSSRLNWRYRWRQPWALMTAGATIIDERDYRTLLDVERDLSGYRVFLAAGLPYVTINLAQFDLSGQSGWQSAISTRLGDADISFSWQKANGFSHVVGASVSMPLGPTRLRSSVFRANDTGATQYRVEARSNFPQQRASAYFKAITDQDNNESARRLAVGGSLRGNYGVSAYEYRELAGQRQQVFDLATAFAVGPEFKAAITTPQSNNAGVAVVNVGLPGVEVQSLGGKATSDSRGLALIPVSGFGKRQAAVNLKSLPDRYFLHVPAVDVSVMPGQSAYAVLRPRLLTTSIKIPNGQDGDQVMVNGHVHIVEAGHVLSDRLRAGPNEVKSATMAWTFVLDQPDPPSVINLEAN